MDPRTDIYVQLHGAVREMTADIRHILEDVRELREDMQPLLRRIEALEKELEKTQGRLTGFVAASTLFGSIAGWILQRLVSG